MTTLILGFLGVPQSWMTASFHLGCLCTLILSKAPSPNCLEPGVGDPTSITEKVGAARMRGPEAPEESLEEGPRGKLPGRYI